MRFPGRRKHQHYFPNQQKNVSAYKAEQALLKHPYIVGLDQVIVDIQAHVDGTVLDRFGLQRGRSQLVDSETAQALYLYLQEHQLIEGEFPGGTIGNTMHNYSVLADDRSILYGVMSQKVQVGTYAYQYLCKTSSKVDLNHLHPVDGSIGLGYTLITEDGERTFAISSGKMNHIPPNAISEDIIKEASAFVLAAYFERGSEEDTLREAALQAIELANKHDIPVVLTLGTHHLIGEKQQWWQEFIAKHVTVLAMNEEEAYALTGIEDPLLAAEQALEWVDLVLCTAGSEGLYMAGYTDEQFKRETEKQVQLAPIKEFNRYEYSRPMRKKDCDQPFKVYSHVAPYMGGPDQIKNTNGAGDGALSALLHDLTANKYHKLNMPDSERQKQPAMCYSSFSQISKYANRVSYEVLIQHSPRLSKGLPEREDCLDSSFWTK